MSEIPRSQVLNTILTRRSVRAFLPDPIPPEHLDQLIDALRWAPSAGNRQPWHFYLILNRQIKQSLVHAAYGQTFLAEAPVVFVICALPGKSASRYGSRGRDLYVYQDTATAAENLMLTAVDLNYGCCWVGAFDEQAVIQTLNLPKGYRPVAIVPVGTPGEKPSPTPRAAVNEILTKLE
jgi:nitroreductase